MPFVFQQDELAERLTRVGLETGERVWRMPLGRNTTKQIDSQFADMKKHRYRNGGSITAAQFLQRFVDDTPVGRISTMRERRWRAEIRDQSQLGFRFLERSSAERLSRSITKPRNS